MRGNAFGQTREKHAGRASEKNKHVNCNMTASLGLSPRSALLRVSETLIIFVQRSMCRPPRTAVGSE